MCVHSGIQAERAAPTWANSSRGGVQESKPIYISIYQAFAYDMSANIPLIKASHMTKSQSRRAGKYSSPTRKSWYRYVILFQETEELREMQSTTGCMTFNHSTNYNGISRKEKKQILRQFLKLKKGALSDITRELSNRIC